MDPQTQEGHWPLYLETPAFPLTPPPTAFLADPKARGLTLGTQDRLALPSCRQWGSTLKILSALFRPAKTQDTLSSFVSSFQMALWGQSDKS